MRRAPRGELSRREDRSHLVNDAGSRARDGHDIDIDAEQPRQCRCHRSERRVTYRESGWPVTCHRDQGWLSLKPDTVARVIPAPRAAEVRVILAARRCPPPVLVHLEAPEHRIVLAGQRDGVALPWPPGVRRVIGVLVLPPTVSPRGPVTWVHPPQPNTLRLRREVDVVAAVRTALRELRPGGPSPGGDPPT